MQCQGAKDLQAEMGQYGSGPSEDLPEGQPLREMKHDWGSLGKPVALRDWKHAWREKDHFFSLFFFSAHQQKLREPTIGYSEVDVLPGSAERIDWFNNWLESRTEFQAIQSNLCSCPDKGVERLVCAGVQHVSLTMVSLWCYCGMIGICKVPGWRPKTKDKELKISQYIIHNVAQVERRNSEPADTKGHNKENKRYNQQLSTTWNTRVPRNDSTWFRNSSENQAGLGDGAEPDGRCLRRYGDMTCVTRSHLQRPAATCAVSPFRASIVFNCVHSELPMFFLQVEAVAWRETSCGRWSRTIRAWLQWTRGFLVIQTRIN